MTPYGLPLIIVHKPRFFSDSYFSVVGGFLQITCEEAFENNELYTNIVLYSSQL